jgi:hypothetical protein
MHAGLLACLQVEVPPEVLHLVPAASAYLALLLLLLG